jgi:hypothetical protein
MTDQELLHKLDRLKAVMIAVATGGPRIGDVEAEFTRDYDEFDAECAFRRWRTVDPGMTDSLGAKRRKLCG